MTVIFKNISSIGKYKVKEAGPKYIFNVLNRRYGSYSTLPAISHNGTVYRTGGGDALIKTNTFDGIDSKTASQAGAVFTGITYDGTQFILSTQHGKVYTSNDLSSFTLRYTIPAANYTTKIISSGNNYLLMTPDIWIYHGSDLTSLTQSAAERSMTACCTDGTYWYICAAGGNSYGNFIKRATIGSSSFTTLWSDSQPHHVYKPYSITHYNNTIIAGTGGGYVYRSTSASNYTSWSFVAATGISGQVYNVANANGKWYALSEGVSKSTDDGLTWSSAGAPTNISWIHLHVVDANVLYLIGATGEIAKSVNNGASWQLINGLGNDLLSSIIRTPVNTLCISTFGTSVYRNNTGVFTKNQTTLPQYSYTLVSTQVGIYASNQDETNTDPKISKSTDNGVTFVSVAGPGINNFNAEAEYNMATDGNTTIVAGLSTGTISRTIDGTNWVDTGVLIGAGSVSPSVYYVNNKFFAFGRNGVGQANRIYHAVSSDGVTWQSYTNFAVNGANGVSGLAFNGTYYFALMNPLGTDKLYRSTDGINWTFLSSNLENNINYSYNRIDHNSSGLIYDGYNLLMCTTGGQILSSVDGVTWVEKHSGEQQFMSIAKFGSDIYAIGYGGTVVHTSLSA